MKLNVTRHGEVLKVVIEGAVNIEDVEPLKTRLRELEGEKFREVILDLAQVPHMASAGIGKLLIFYKNLMIRDQKMSIKGIDGELAKLFKSLQLQDCIPIER